MGTLHTKKRARAKNFQKCRRNNRILEKFHDVMCVDLRDGETKSDAQLSCGRTNRSESRHGPKNERVFRAKRAEKRLKRGGISVSKGKRGIRRGRSPFRPGDIGWISGTRHVVHGAYRGGTRIILKDGKSVAAAKVDKTVHTGGWRQL